MKLLLLGATGRTGRLVLAEALRKGFEVNSLVRDAGKIEPQTGLTVYEGNPANKLDLEKSIQGCNYIISALNISRTSDFPWAPLRTPERYLSEVMDQLIPLAEERELQHVSICSAWGVFNTKSDLPKWFRWLIDHSNIGVAYSDHERQETLLIRSNLNWTIIRPVGLTNSKRKEDIRETLGTYPRPGLTISRLSVAKYLLQSLTDHQLLHQKVTISKKSAREKFP